MTYPSFLLKVGHHDDDGDVLLPDHAPEVIEGALHRSLGRDELTLRPVALCSIAPYKTYYLGIQNTYVMHRYFEASINTI